MESTYLQGPTSSQGAQEWHSQDVGRQGKWQQAAGKEIAPPRVACFLFLPSIRLALYFVRFVVGLLASPEDSEAVK